MDDTQDQEPKIGPFEVAAPDPDAKPRAPRSLQASKTLRVTKKPVLASNSPEQEKEPLTPLQMSLRRLWHDKRATVSLGVLVFFVLLALIGPPIYQHIGGQIPSDLIGMIGPDTYHLPDQGQATQHDLGPTALYWLGTDFLGRDILARIMQGTFVSLIVALLVEVIDIALGITIGVLAGYFGGWIDVLLARFTDLMFAFPQILFAILISSVLGPSTDALFSNIPFLGYNYARLVLVSTALAFTTWPLMARYVRGQTLQLKEQQFIEAARTSGTNNIQIILRHIIPNLFSLVLIASTLNIVNTIIGEAGLSLLGLGVKSPGSSLGLMIWEAVQNTNINTHAWEIIVPTTVLTIIVLAISFIGDGLRDAFDPRSNQ
jgi:oligopeptide transport system permease protein